MTEAVSSEANGEGVAPEAAHAKILRAMNNGGKNGCG